MAFRKFDWMFSEWASGMYFVEGVDDKGIRREGKFVK